MIKTAGSKLFRWAERNKRLAWFVCFLPFVFWSFDYQPPLEVLSYHYPEPVYPGGEVSFVMDVKRDLGRKCSVTSSREIIDSAGFRKSFSVEEELSSRALEGLEKVSPDQIRRKHMVPPELPAGKSKMITHLSYRCGVNPLHFLKPIQVMLEWEFDVMPPKPVSAIVIMEK